MKKNLVEAAMAAMCMAMMAGCGSDAKTAESGTPASQAADSEAVSTESAQAATESAGEKQYESELVNKILEQGYFVATCSPGLVPYSFYDTRQTGVNDPVGVDIEVGEAIADYLGVEVRWTVSDNPGDAIAALNANNVDLIINGLTITDERKESVLFSDPYVETANVLIVRADDADTFQTVDDFTGKNIGAPMGSAQSLFVTDEIPGAQLLELDSYPNMIVELVSGNIDAVCISEISGVQYVVSNDDICFSSVDISNGEAKQQAVAARLGETELIGIVNEVIAQCKDEGLLDQWTEEYSEIAAELNE